MATIPQGSVWDTTQKKWVKPSEAYAIAGKQIAPQPTVATPQATTVSFTPATQTTINVPDTATQYQSEVMHAPDWVNQERLAEQQKASISGSPLAVPTKTYNSIGEISSDNSLTRYEKNAKLQQYYKDKGISFEAKYFPTSADEELQNLLDTQDEQKSYLEQQVEAAKQKSTTQFKGTAGALQATFAQGREAPISAGNALIAQKTIGQMEQDRQLAFAELDQQLKTLKDKQSEQLRNYTDARAEEIATIQADLANKQAKLLAEENKRTTLANQTAQQALENRKAQVAEISNLDLSQLSDADITQLQANYPNIDSEYLQLKRENDYNKRQTQESKDKVALQKSYMDMFTTNIDNGIEMPNSAILAYSKQSGIPAEMFIGFNTAAKQIKDMKGVDEAYKQAQMDNLKLDMDRKIKGLDNADIEKFTFIAKLRAAGADEETVSEFMRVAGIKDPNDPYFQALVKNLEADYIKKLNDTGSILAVKDVSGLDKDIGKKGGQCGRYVNNYLGKPGFFGNTYESKTSRINSQTPAVGSVFVYPPTKNNPYGHVGIVKSVNDDGTITAIDSNWSLDEKVKEHNILTKNIAGYYVPETKSTTSSLDDAWNTNYNLYKKGTLSEQSLRSTMESIGKTPAEKQKIREYIEQKLSETTKKMVGKDKVFGVPLSYGMEETKTYPLKKGTTEESEDSLGIFNQ